MLLNTSMLLVFLQEGFEPAPSELDPPVLPAYSITLEQIGGKTLFVPQNAVCILYSFEDVRTICWYRASMWGDYKGAL